MVTGHDAAVREHDPRIRVGGEVRIVGDEHDRRAPPAVDIDQEIDDVAAVLTIEIAGWLVGEDNRRVVGERTGDCHALLLTTREL